MPRAAFAAYFLPPVRMKPNNDNRDDRGQSGQGGQGQGGQQGDQSGRPEQKDDERRDGQGQQQR